MEKIFSITEAYSMQPESFAVKTKEQMEKYFDKPNACKEIKLERVIIGDPQTGDALWAYIGYNFEDQKIFQYLAISVNVRYYH